MKLISKGIVSFLVLCLVGAGALWAAPTQETEVNTLKFAFAAAADSTSGKTAYMIKDRLEAESGGRLKVEVYPGGQLGGDREMLEACQAGDISIVFQATAPQVSFIPEVAVFDMPAVLTDPQVAVKMLGSGVFRDAIGKYYERAGLKLVQLAPGAFREMSSNKAVRSTDDFKGIKIRTMENKYHMAYWKSLGANPTPLAFGELYVALQQNLVQAQENPVELLLASKLSEVQKYVILTHHILFIATAVMNKDLYDGMPADLQSLIMKVNYDAGVEGLKNALASAESTLKSLKEQGKEVIQPSAEAYSSMKAAALPVYDMIRQDVGTELVDSMLAAYKAASN
ncbi:MAG: TRAP transporter substrate-binding protein [Spirochaetota bacterium]